MAKYVHYHEEPFKIAHNTIAVCGRLVNRLSVSRGWDAVTCPKCVLISVTRLETQRESDAPIL